ncbi:MAG TPA: DedA family protein [Myxococcales bacterium]|nr:DedA family protein [Myxococcales bacterium]
MDVRQLIETYGYYAVFAGALLEGETLLIMAGFSVHLGYLALLPALACAALGGLAGDQFWFFLGRRHRAFALRRFPGLRLHQERVTRLLARYDALLIPPMRFLYGLRIAGPVLIGMSKIAAWRFFALDLLGAIVWAALVIGAGYAFGRGLESALGRLHHHERLLVFAAIAAAGAAYWIFRWASRRRSRSAP